MTFDAAGAEGNAGEAEGIVYRLSAVFLLLYRIEIIFRRHPVRVGHGIPQNTDILHEELAAAAANIGREEECAAGASLTGVR